MRRGRVRNAYISYHGISLMRKDMLTIDMRLKMLISKMIMIKATIIWRVSRNQPVGKRPFPFGGRSAIVIRQDMSPHVQALLQ